MKQKLIRDIPDEVLAAIEQKAQAADVSSEAYIRRLLVSDVQTPVVRERYAYRFYGDDANAYGTIARHSNHENGIGGSYRCSTDAQMQAVKKAKDLMGRNEPGDQLKVYTLLKSVFVDVFEIPA